MTKIREKEKMHSSSIVQSKKAIPTMDKSSQEEREREREREREIYNS
jgi:hypothetical protein